MDPGTQAIHDWLKQHKITEIECTVPDITGNARGKFIPVDQFLKGDQPRLPESILVQSITGEYSDEHWSFVQANDGDMLLKPDASTLRLVPWAREPTAQIIHDCYQFGSDQLHPLSTRTVLRKVLDLYTQEGLKPVVAPEVEFFLVARNLDPDTELAPPVGRSGRAETSRQSYSIDAVSEFEEFVADMYDYAEAQQLNVDSLIHENGAAQMEINFLHGDPMNLADQVFAFKRTVRETAHKHGIYATFMAKPAQRECGSAMHIHQSLVRIEDGSNIFADENGEHTAEFLSYIAGLQKYTPELISLYAPNVNSYRRLAPEIAAPINLNWGLDNRTTAFRVPNSNRAGTRVENRFPGADVNPYLAFAATLASGYLGMKKKLEPSKPHQGTSNESDIEVARSLEEGLRHLCDTPELVEIFGEVFLRAYSAVKRSEFEEFNRVISSWEREHLLLQV
jgi:glutamine synthetase